MNAKDHLVNAAASPRDLAMSANNQPGIADAPRRNGAVLANNQDWNVDALPKENGAVLANNQPGIADAPRKTGAMLAKNQDGNVDADANSKTSTAAVTLTPMTAVIQTGDTDVRRNSISATYVKRHHATASTSATNATSQNTFANAAETLLR
jgi:hypothetical protein